MATLLVDADQIPYLQFGEVQWWYFPDDGSGMPYYDEYTTSTFAATYGHPMHVFTNSNVSPALFPQEALFLSGLIGTFTDAIMSLVRQTFPNAKFEVLYAPDVNDTPLNGAVNLPSSWNPLRMATIRENAPIAVKIDSISHIPVRRELITFSGRGQGCGAPDKAV
jgi:hypothetical protein